MFLTADLELIPQAQNLEGPIFLKQTEAPLDNTAIFPTLNNNTYGLLHLLKLNTKL